jgi:trigger factor
MKITKKDLDKSQVELTIEVSLKEIKPHLDKAANKMAANKKIPGFRPGKAPYDLVKNKFGEMTILQAAIDSIVSETYFKAVTSEKLQAVGQPQINVEKIAPNNPIVYKAIVALLPKITLGDWKSLSVKKQSIKASDEEVEKAIQQLQSMNVKEKISNKAISKGDKAEIDFEVTFDKVVIEGGKHNKYPIVIGEGNMIPGFEDNLIGMKKGEEKKFDLKFPDKYFQESLAGKEHKFAVKVTEVYKRDLPKLDDAFAKTIGFESLDKFKKQLVKNIVQEKTTKEEQRVEVEAIKAIGATSEIADIPQILIHNEVHKMLHELEHSIKQQGMDMDGYLKSIKKTKEDMQKDFEPQAIERIKGALILRQISDEEKITIDDKQIDEELAKQEKMYKDNPQAMQNIKQPDYRAYLQNLLANQAVIKFINEKIIK